MISPAKLSKGLPVLFPFGLYGMHRMGVHPYWGFALLAGVFVVQGIDVGWRRLKWPFLLLASSCVPVWLVAPENIPRLYPFLMSALALAMFAKSSGSGHLSAENALESFTRRFVSISDWERNLLKSLNPLWICGLAINTAVLFVLLFGFSMETWFWYAGVGSYFLLGTLFAVTAMVMLKARHSRGCRSYRALWWRKPVFLAKFSVGFGIYGILCILLIMFLPVIWVGCRFRPGRFQRTVQWICLQAFQFVLYYLRVIRFIDVQIVWKGGSDRDQIPAPGIIVCNHISMFDIVAILSTFPNCYTFVKSKFLRIPFISPIIRACGFVPVNEEDHANRIASYEKALEYVRRGHFFVVFPEGTRTRDGQLGRFQNGVFRMALETGVPLIPVVFSTDQPIFNNVAALRPTAGCIRYQMQVMPAIRPPAVPVSRMETVRLRDKVRERFEQWLESQDTLKWNRMNTFEYRGMTIRLDENADALVRASLEVKGEQWDFNGHFPGWPIWPGLSQIDLVCRVFEVARNCIIDVGQIQKAKFLHMVRPGTNLTVIIEPQTARFVWSLSDGDRLYSKGALSYAISQ